MNDVVKQTLLYIIKCTSPTEWGNRWHYVDTRGKVRALALGLKKAMERLEEIEQSDYTATGCQYVALKALEEVKRIFEKEL